MSYYVLADLVVLVHFLFVLFVIFGGGLVFWKPWLAWAHLPAALYGLLIEWVGWACPLTPLENALRRQAGGAGYEGGWVEHYILPLLYPEAFTRTLALVLGAAVLLINVAIYGLYLWRR
ncbi:DUF2784 domain-containing protein [Nitrococcus mobilis]|uniref:DUF2784 domain-containing protein n=1 Tax=Nitrococcus mobilis Nb-231 TaxID=314278 RepID=A4BNL0_9GAMM|nr:DUF2784 domain-containing protein [Nitrococcus mobilis]EAR22809.1 hypothetical protein NB231_10163 [Nitrococcus mobilis Nb-231]